MRLKSNTKYHHSKGQIMSHLCPLGSVLPVILIMASAWVGPLGAEDVLTTPQLLLQSRYSLRQPQWWVINLSCSQHFCCSTLDSAWQFSVKMMTVALNNGEIAALKGASLSQVASSYLLLEGGHMSPMIADFQDCLVCDVWLPAHSHISRLLCTSWPPYFKLPSGEACTFCYDYDLIRRRTVHQQPKLELSNVTSMVG